MIPHPTGRTAVITSCSQHRWDHLMHQRNALQQQHPEVPHFVMWLDAGSPPSIPGATVISIPPGPHGLRLAAARNRGAEAAISNGATLLVFLDADCVPGPNLLPRYLQAAREYPLAVLCGPVTYLAKDFAMSTSADLHAATRPHPGRPAPADGATVAATRDEYALFWSLSFSLSAQLWRTAGGFDERYQGYGAEDTDFGWQLRSLDIPLRWVGGADAYHQYHPTSTPPWHNISDIVRNAGLFFDRWYEWPMEGWLHAFQAAGAVVLEGGRYRLAETYSPASSALPNR